MADGSVSTLTNPVTGTGTTNYVPKWTSGSAIGNSQIFDNGTNVGIGTTSPSALLTIDSGEPRFRMNRGGTQEIIINHDGTTGVFRTESNTPLAIGTNGSEQMRITNTGNVGIGTTSPDIYGFGGKVLSVNGGTSYTNLVLAGDADSGIAFGTSSARLGQISMDSTNGMRIFSSGAGDGMTMILNRSGRVGIGTTTPASPLQVSAASVLSQGTLSIVNTYASGGVYFPTARFIQQRGDHSFGIVSEFYTGATNGTDRPSILFNTGNSSNSWQVGMATSGWAGNDSFGIGYRASNDPASFNTWPTARFLITTGGNVLIGTTTDSGEKLVVNGTIGIPFTSTIRVAGGGYTRNDIISTGYNNVSDLKDFLILEAPGSSNGKIILGTGGYVSVGIGTNAPSSGLVVATYGSKWDSDSQYNQPAGNIFSNLAICVADQENWIGLRGSYGSSTGSANLLLQANFRDVGSNAGHYVASQAISLGNADFVIGRIQTQTSVSTAPAKVEQLRIFQSGKLKLNLYGSGTFTGTPTYNLGVDSSGNVIELPGGVVDGSGTANYVTKWQDANTVTNSSITDDGSTVTALVNRLAMNQQAGIYVFPKSVGPSAAVGIFEIKNTHGAQALRVSFVCSTSGYSVAKTYEVVHQFAVAPVYSKVVDTGPFSGHDFNVAFNNNGDNTGLVAIITNNSTTLTANIVATVFLGGSSTTITITAL
jgi:hypothetical protein